VSKKKKTKKNISKPVFGVSKNILLIISAVWIYIVTSAFLRGRLVEWDIFYLFDLQGSFNFLEFLRLLLSYLISVIFFAGTITGIHFIGDSILSLCKITFKSPEERALMATGLGTGILGLIIFAFALLGFLYPFVMYALWLAGSVFGFKKIRKAIKNFSFKELKPSAGEKITLALIFLVLLFGFIMSFTPEIFYDSLNYHLGVPNIYMQFGHYVELPYKFHSSFPLVSQMAFLFTLMVDSTASAKLLNLSFVIFTALAIYIFSRDRLSSPKTGLYAGAIYILIPNVMFRSWTATTDTLLTFLTFLSLWAAINFICNRNLYWLILSGLFAGLLAGTKLNGFFFFPGIAALIFTYCRSSIWKAVKYTAIWAGVSLLLFSPWMIRNTLETGNPFYPFFSEQLTSKHPYDIPLGRDTYEEAAERFRRFDRFKNLMHLGWNISIKGGREGPYDSHDYYMSGAVFLIFIPLLLLFKGDEKERKLINMLFLFSLFSFVLWGIQDDKVKYFSPAFPAFSLLSAVAVRRLSFSGGLGSILSKGTLIYHLIVNLLVMSFLAHYVYMPFSVVTGMISRDDFLSESRPMYPNPSYDVFEYAHRNLKKDDVKIMVSGEAKTYHLKLPHIAFSASPLDPLILYSNSKKTETGEDLYRLLKEREFTHIIFNAPEVFRTAGSGFFKIMEKRDILIIREFFKNHLNLLYTSRGVFLYEIVETSDSPVENPVLTVFVKYFSEEAQNALELAQSETDPKKKKKHAETAIEKSGRIIEADIGFARARYLKSHAYYILKEEEKALYYAKKAAEKSAEYEEFYMQVKNAFE